MPFDTPGLAEPERAVLPMSHILGALSHALDLTEGQPPGHCMRSCWIGLQVGRRIGLTAPELANLYYAVLPKDLGCSSNAARIAQLYAADDRAFKHDSKTLAQSRSAALRFILQHVNPASGLFERLRTTLHVIRKADEIVQDLIEVRCERGAGIARKLGLSPAVSDGIFHLDEHWDGRGRPAGLRGQGIPLFSRIALLAQVADVFFTAAGPEAAIEEVALRSGRWLDPALVDAFRGAAREPGFWSTLASPELDAAVLALAPTQRSLRADDTMLDEIARAFAEVIDAKSPFTSGHSQRVASYAGQIAAHMGLGAVERRRLERAALLHDIGKLGVSNRILDKPGKLDDGEWRVMREHAVHSQRILSRIPAFAELAEIGGSHHERLDGRGYPNALEAGRIGLATRIVSAADVCDALTAERPYRAAMTVEQMLGVMGKDEGTAFDPACLSALRDLAGSGALMAAGA